LVGLRLVNKIIMGNYTWFVRCVANHPVEDNNCVPVVDLLANFHAETWYFDEWLEGLSDEARVRLEKAKKMKDAKDFKAKLLKHDVFPKTVSLNTLMSFFEDQKFYGYLDGKMMKLLNYINDHCLPRDVEMVMIGIYEGFGPVAMGWCTPPNETSRRFVSMKGFETYSASRVFILRNEPMSLQDHIENYKMCMLENGYELGSEDIELETTSHTEAEHFRSIVLDPLSMIDWSTSPTSICQWLLSHGFELEYFETDRKTQKMMGCPQQ
jgi:hypothetical protein